MFNFPQDMEKNGLRVVIKEDVMFDRVLLLGKKNVDFDMAKWDMPLLIIVLALTLVFQITANRYLHFLLYIRIILLVYLYMRLLTFVKIKPQKNIVWLIAFLGYSFFVGILTYFFYDLHMAAAGFSRFINVALFAPLAAYIPKNNKDLEMIVGTWLFFVVLAAMSVAFQLAGGNLSWFTHGYLAVRVDIQRYMSILGEPNAGAMSAVILYIASLMWIRHWIWRITLLISIAFIFVSLSKAATMLTLFGTIFIFIISVLNKKKMMEIFYRLIYAFMASFICVFAINLFSADMGKVVEKYGSVQYNSLIGKNSKTSLNVLQEINSRTVDQIQSLAKKGFVVNSINTSNDTSTSMEGKTISQKKVVVAVEQARKPTSSAVSLGSLQVTADSVTGIPGAGQVPVDQSGGENFKYKQKMVFLLKVLVGNSYGIAGSAAETVLGVNNALLPHDGILEIYLVGGLFLSALFFVIIFLTTRELCLACRNDEKSSACFLFVSFFLLFLSMFGYPTMYQPALGSFFWLIIGATFNRKLFNEKYRVCS